VPQRERKRKKERERKRERDSIDKKEGDQDRHPWKCRGKPAFSKFLVCVPDESNIPVRETKLNSVTPPINFRGKKHN
jgi:hypothetical protein